jgi:hypothetical protein
MKSSSAGITTMAIMASARNSTSPAVKASDSRVSFKKPRLSVSL